MSQLNTRNDTVIYGNVTERIQQDDGSITIKYIYIKEKKKLSELSTTINLVFQSTDSEIEHNLAPVCRTIQDLTLKNTIQSLKNIEGLISSYQSSSHSIDEL